MTRRPPRAPEAPRPNYHGHEREYQRMREGGMPSWGERDSVPEADRFAVDPPATRFLEDMLELPWAPREGRFLEVGCGTGPISRWLAERGYSGLGLDVSPTALEMAREQSVGLAVEYREHDFTEPPPGDLGRFELIVDGRCLHCLADPARRRAFFENARTLLAEGGVLAVLTMTSPVDRRGFGRRCPGQRLEKGVIWTPWDEATRYSDHRVIDGKPHIPTRCVPHWREVLRELRRAGFVVRLHRFTPPWGTGPMSELMAAAQLRG